MGRIVVVPSPLFKSLPVLSAVPNGQSEIDLASVVLDRSDIRNYQFDAAPTPNGPWSTLTIQSGNALAHNGLVAGQTVYYRSRVMFNTGRLSNFTPAVSATTVSGGIQIYRAPGVRYTVGKLGGEYGSISQAMSDWTAQCTNVANKNSSRIVQGFQLCVRLPLLMPAVQGDWAHSQGIALLTQAWRMLQTLPNGPYDMSVQCNMVANTFGGTVFSAGAAQGFIPPWWYDNIAFGPVGGNQHGGVYWDNLAAGHCTTRFWNSACMNEVYLCYQAIYQALEALGIHIYRIEPTMEISNAAAMQSAGMTDAALAATWDTFAGNMRAALPTSMLAFCLTFPAGQSDTPTILEAVLKHNWSLTNYDGCAQQAPPDLPTGHSGISWGDLAFNGQTSVNGPVVSKNYHALGYDHHNNVVADELGNSGNSGTNPVPNADIGTGRMGDIVTMKIPYQGSSHLYIYADPFKGPPCNTTGSYPGQPANYKYPATGAVVPYTNSVAHLAALNVKSFLNLNKPAAWS